MFKSVLCAALSISALSAFAQTADTATQPQSVSTVFSQQVFYTIPKQFNSQLQFEQNNGNSYINERALNGETVESWTQLITVTGEKDLTKNPNISPWAIIGTLVQGFQTACPSSFSGLKMFDAQINGHPATAAVLSCGMLNNQSETALIIAIRGVNDYYTVQWAEHGKASSKPLKLDEEKWLARFNALELGLHTATSPNR